MVIISSRVCWGYGGLKLKKRHTVETVAVRVWLRGVCAVRCGYGRNGVLCGLLSAAVQQKTEDLETANPPPKNVKDGTGLLKRKNTVLCACTIKMKFSYNTVW